VVLLRGLVEVAHTDLAEVARMAAQSRMTTVWTRTRIAERPITFLTQSRGQHQGQDDHHTSADVWNHMQSMHNG
jgi:hypothetical protein